jgi:hypothetical protein
LICIGAPFSWADENTDPAAAGSIDDVNTLGGKDSFARLQARVARHTKIPTLGLASVEFPTMPKTEPMRDSQQHRTCPAVADDDSAVSR